MKSPIATGIGYKTNGSSYKYPIFTEQELAIVTKSGGKTV